MERASGSVGSDEQAILTCTLAGGRTSRAAEHALATTGGKRELRGCVHRSAYPVASRRPLGFIFPKPPDHHRQAGRTGFGGHVDGAPLGVNIPGQLAGHPTAQRQIGRRVGSNGDHCTNGIKPKRGQLVRNLGRRSVRGPVPRQPSR